MALESRVRIQLEAGDPDAAATSVIQELGPSVLGYLCALHGDDDGEDVFSAWAENVWKGVPRFRFEAPLRAWAYRVAWYASAHLRRDPWRRRRQRLASSAAARLAASITRSGAGKPSDERLAWLRTQLGPEDHTLLILRLDREMSWDEISRVLSKDGHLLRTETLRKRYERLKGRLTRRARQRGFLR